MKHHIILYIATLVVLVGVDMLWLGGIAKDFYRNQIGEQLQFTLLPGVIFYLLYAAGIVVFVHGGANDGWKSVMLYGALFGLVAYGTYDLTNAATLKFWSTTLLAVDMAWGTFVTALTATAGWFAVRWLENM